MKEPKPIVPHQPITLVKRILFYFNVSAVKIGMEAPVQSNRSKGFGSVIIVISEYKTAQLLFPQMTWFHARYILLFGIIFHWLIDFLFTRDLVVMSANYNFYYHKILLYLFLVFIAIGIVGGLISLNNSIGHVR